MKKQYVTVLFTLVCVLGLWLGARAQEEDTVVAKVPYDFIVGSKTLPAGTYTVMRVAGRVDDAAGHGELEISSNGTHASAFLLPTFFDDVQTGHARLDFEHVGDKYFLSAIETPIGTYAVTISRSAVKIAQMEQQDASPSGGN